MLAEQVSGNLAVIVGDVEQRLVGRDDRPAGDPSLAVPVPWWAFVLAFIEAQPFGLLLLCGERQGTDRLAVDLVLGIELADGFCERGERQNAARSMRRSFCWFRR